MKKKIGDTKKKINSPSKQKKPINSTRKKESIISRIISTIMGLFKKPSKKIIKPVAHIAKVPEPITPEPIAVKATQAQASSPIANEDSEKSKFGDKFQKSGIKAPKSLKDIAEESRKKSDEIGDKKFSEGDAALKDLKKAEAGHTKFVKKKTKKSLEGKVFLIRGKDNGRPAWHYVLVDPEKMRALKSQKSGTNIDVTDYGRIVKSGWGEDPSDEIIKEVEEEYGD